MTRRYRYIVGVLLLVGMAVFALYDSQPLRSYINEPVDPERSVLAVYPEEIDFTRTYENIGRLRLYPLTETTGTVEDVVKEYRLPYWYYPVSVLSFQTCREGTDRRSTFTVLSKDELTLIPIRTERAFAVFTKEESRMSGWNKYNGLLIMNGCTPRTANILHEVIREAGSSYTVLYGLTSWGYPPSTERGTVY